MAESEHTQENLAYIRTHVERLEQLVRFEISANRRNAEAVVERFTGRAGMAEVYLALDGAAPKTQDELVSTLNKSQPTVSRILKELCDAGFVIKVPSLSNRQVMGYTWSDLEQLLGVSKLARRSVSAALKAPANGAGGSGRPGGRRTALATESTRSAPQTRPEAPQRGTTPVVGSEQAQGGNSGDGRTASA